MSSCGEAIDAYRYTLNEKVVALIKIKNYNAIVFLIKEDLCSERETRKAL